MTNLSRRTALECMLWAGAGLVWTVDGGVPRTARAADSGFMFAQVSDCHLGFRGDPNMDTPATFRRAIDMVRATGPAFVLHTGDVSHLSKPDQLDMGAQILRESGAPTYVVPGEHDWLDNGTGYREHFGMKGTDRTWYAFDSHGVHFVGLNNIAGLGSSGLGRLGQEQLDWLGKDLVSRPSSQPILIFAHIPLWSVYPQWGWATEETPQILALLKRFGSVTVLNGHIHQVLQKVEGHVTFHTALSTAFPQPAPGSAAHPGPYHIEPGTLASHIGVRRVTFAPGRSELATIDTSLA
jgi:3',5'-cyclic-AMP phosphodiesterase